MAAQNPILHGTVSGQMAVPHRSWLGRNWKWLLLVAFLAVIAFVAGLFTLIMGGIRSSDVAKEAVARAQASPFVTQRLGAAIDEGWMMSGSINVAAGGTGDADLAVDVYKRQPHFQVNFPASNSGRADGVGRFRLADLSVAARSPSIHVPSGPRLPRGNVVDAMAPSKRRKRSTMEAAGQRSGRATKHSTSLINFIGDVKSWNWTCPVSQLVRSFVGIQTLFSRLASIVLCRARTKGSQSLRQLGSEIP